MLSARFSETVSADEPPLRLAERAAPGAAGYGSQFAIIRSGYGRRSLPFVRRRSEMSEDMEDVAEMSLMPSISCMPLKSCYFTALQFHGILIDGSHSLRLMWQRARVATRSA